MNKRQIQLTLCLIKKDDWITGEQLASYLGVSSRTIRNDIQFLKSTGLIIKSSKQDGYRLENVEDGIRLLEQNNEFPESAHERMMVVLKTLLKSSEPKNIYDLADDLFVSESTIEKDLYHLKAVISNTEDKVQLKRTANTFVIEGSTRAKRTLWSKLLLHEVKESAFDINVFENQFDDINLKKIKEVLEDALRKYELHFTDLSILSMVIHIAIVIDTIQRNEETISSTEIDFISSKEELSAAHGICDKLENMYHVTIPPPERDYLAILLGGKKSSSYKGDRKATVTNGFFSKLVNDLLMSIDDTFLVDLSNDEELFTGLVMHFKSLYNRNRRSVEIHNPILTDTKKRFPFIYDMGIFMGMQYEKETGQKLNEDEIGLLTLHLCIAFERIAKQEQAKKRIAILCPTGFTTSRLLKVKLENVYGEQIDELELFSISDRNSITKFNPDLILTTSKVSEDFPFDTIEVSPFLSEQDEKKLNAYFQSIDQVWGSEDINSYFYRSLFFKDLNFQTPNEVIAFLSSKLEDQAIVPPGYNDLILSREAISSTAFGNLIALPHPIEKVAKKTVISVGILNKPIQWGIKKYNLFCCLLLQMTKGS
ncbi:PRD domain-containing protein [Virgibacillus sp. NKC19-3]|nr:PRD domain-containing protein [Virgibacillus sp. NKC19-3]MBY7141972.1 PRD domain-containing protein [Virgibacillus sp. NKC19-3]